MRPIPGQPGYFADEAGRIWSTKQSGSIWGMSPFVRGRDGHLALNLTQDGKYRMFAVHSLVALAFHGPRPAGMVVMHLDDDPKNNRPSNLRYGTPAENSAQMKSRGRQARGERASAAVLTVVEVLRMRELFAAGASLSLVAGAFGISKT